MLKLKQKGAYWHPQPDNYAESISNASPPSWHKDLGNIVSIRAAVAAMVHGFDPETFIRLHTDPFDFMCRIKVNRSDSLHLGSTEVQRTTRYYVAAQGDTLMKVSPPPAGHVVGQWKRKSGVTIAQYNAVMSANGGAWDEAVCTKSKTQYEDRRTAIQAGYKIAECNDVRSFDFGNIDYSWYVQEARKLIIS